MDDDDELSYSIFIRPPLLDGESHSVIFEIEPFDSEEEAKAFILHVQETFFDNEGDKWVH